VRKNSHRKVNTLRSINLPIFIIQTPDIAVCILLTLNFSRDAADIIVNNLVGFFLASDSIEKLPF